MVSNGSLVTAPDFKSRLERLRSRGGGVVVFDPRRTETARAADEHYFVRPGTDALAAVTHVLFEERAVRLDHLAPVVKNLAELERLVAAFTPELAADRCGVDAATIRRLARDPP